MFKGKALLSPRCGRLLADSLLCMCLFSPAGGERGTRLFGSAGEQPWSRVSIQPPQCTNKGLLLRFCCHFSATFQSISAQQWQLLLLEMFVYWKAFVIFETDCLPVFVELCLSSLSLSVEFSVELKVTLTFVLLKNCRYMSDQAYW